MTPGDGLAYLRETMAILRGENGCEWDREQDHRSLIPYLIEETAELVDAIEGGSRDELVDELGDVLYQVLFHADIIANDPNHPVTIDDVAQKTAEKMRTRHPHVFDGLSVSGVEEIRANWVKQKRTEDGAARSIVDQVPHSLHPIARAQALFARAARNELALTPDDIDPSADNDLGGAILALIKDAAERGVDVDGSLRQAIRRLEGVIVGLEQPSVGDSDNA